MSPGTPRAVVSLAALDLRVEPDHRAELGSQLLLGEVVALLARPRRDGWQRVRSLTDGYAGWVRTWGLVPATVGRARRWTALARASVAEPIVAVRALANGGVGVGPLFLGSRVIPGRRRGAMRAVELPDGRRGWVAASALRELGAPPPALVDRVGSLFGTPYLWGGRTPAGLDCSAFVQLVLAEQGVALPRDARDQFAACRPLPKTSAARVGDLVFFAAPGEAPGHVGVGLGDGFYAHGRGRVCLAHVDPQNPLCDKALMPQLVGWRRPRRRGRG